jgi:hypothetical protein
VRRTLIDARLSTERADTSQLITTGAAVAMKPFHTATISIIWSMDVCITRAEIIATIMVRYRSLRGKSVKSLQRRCWHNAEVSRLSPNVGFQGIKRRFL